MVHELMEKSDGPKEKALQANNAIENYMFDNCEWCIQPNKSAFCLVHKGLCPVNPGWALGERFSGTSPEQLQQKLSTGHGLQDCFEGVPAAAWWTSPDFKAEPEDTTPPLVVNISSLICVDFSPLGKQSRTGGDSQQFHSMFLATRRANAVRRHEDIYFTECSRLYPAATQQGRLESTHRVIWAQASAQKLGFPIRRERCLAAGLNRKTMVWCGPDSAKDIQTEFDAIYSRDIVLDASIYFTATAQEAHSNHVEHYHGRRKIPRKGRTGNLLAPPDTFWQQGLFASGQAHKVLNVTNIQIKGQCEELFQKSAMPGPHFANLDQHPQKGSTPGRNIPALDTHPKIYSWSHDRLATPSELYDAMGADTRHNVFSGSRQLSTLSAIIPRLSRREQFPWYLNSLNMCSPFGTWAELWLF